MKPEEQRELWKSTGYCQGFLDGQLLEIRQQIAYEKMSPTEKFSRNMRDLFNLLDKKGI